MADNLNSKESERPWALVTGASSGIGYEYTLLLAEKSYHLVTVSIEKEKLETQAIEMRERFGVKVIPVCMDLAANNAAEELYHYCSEQGIVVEVLINNAGFFFFGEAAEASPELAEKKMVLHMMTPSLLCRHFGKDMKQRRSGHILNMSSISAWMPYPGIAFYAATKGYVKSFSRSLRAEMIDYGVNVSCVCPGATATNLFDRDKLDYKKAMRWGIMMPADRVARIGLQGMFRKKAVIIPGRINRITVFLVRLAWPGLILWIKRHTKIIPSE